VLPLICSNHWANHDTSAASCNKSLLCASYPVLVPHSCAITRHHVGQWLPSSPCSPHACRMDAESLPEHLYRLVPGHARSSQRASHHITSPPAICSTPTRPHLHHPRSTTTHRIESTPHSGLLNRSLARAGCNPEFCRPRTPSPKVHSLLLVTEVLLSSPPNSYLQIAGRIADDETYGAVRGLMIKAETHAGTVSLLLTLPTSPRCLGVGRDTYTSL
jgi:hypothetical protein